MPDRVAPFSCTLLRDYPPEDLWEGYLVFGQVQPDGRVYLSEYCEDNGERLGAAFEDNAREGFHYTRQDHDGDVRFPFDGINDAP